MNPAQQKTAAKEFVKRWQAAEGNEDREARSFWIELLQDVLGVPNVTRVIDFERRVKGRKIDAFYEDMQILIESKSRGVDLDHARDNGKKYGFETPYEQAHWYYSNMPKSVAPRWLVLMNFDTIRIHDLNRVDPKNDYAEVDLVELPENLQLFDIFTDNSNSRIMKEQQLSIEAGDLVGELYDAFYKQYQNIETDPHEQHSLNVLIVLIVFLLYAEDADLLQCKQAFCKYMTKFNAEQSRTALIALFDILNTPETERNLYESQDLLAFPYVNGHLFAEARNITIPQFTEDLRVKLLLNASRGFNWRGISPVIFGATMESCMNPETRGQNGNHFTSVENILKCLGPLFLNDLKSELAVIEGEKVAKTRKMKLRSFQDKLSKLRFMDPACGSGNFNTTAFIELRRLENRVLESLRGDQGELDLGDAGYLTVKVSIDQFYGIELLDFATSVARTAMWIAEAQMLEETQEILGTEQVFLPLITNTNIVCANALRKDWNEVLPAESCNYLYGNPPFKGAHSKNPPRTKDQTKDLVDSFENYRGIGDVDYVAAWYAKAAQYAGKLRIPTVFVSTNSIAQGIQPGLIWSYLEKFNPRIDFAYQPFLWGSDASDQAAVAVVIIGFTCNKENHEQSVIYRMNYKTAEVIEAVEVDSINPYLHDAPFTCIVARKNPLCHSANMVFGSMPNDDGNLLLSQFERDEIIRNDPNTERFIKPFVGASEWLNAKKRWCIWLEGISEAEFARCPSIVERVRAVKGYRSASLREATRKLSATPHLFGEVRQPSSAYIIVPRHSSERRPYIPIGFLTPDIICGDSNMLIPDATLYEFGVLCSQFHNAWMRTVAGRIKSDYRYSNKIVYNNFVWPDPAPEQKEHIERCAQLVLDVREQFPDKSLADLYDPDKMPEILKNAHELLDAAVEDAYGVDFGGDEEKIVAHLFKLYAEMTEGE